MAGALVATMGLEDLSSSILHPLSSILASLGVCWLLTAGLIRWSRLLGLIDYPAERKVHAAPTPRGGGLAIYGAVLLSSLLVSICSCQVALFNVQFLLASLIAALGLLDDLRPLPWQLRLAVHLAVAVAAVLFCLPPGPWPLRLAAVVWLVALVNAFNMLDNMDLLSGGVAWITAGFLVLLPLLGFAAAPAAEWFPCLLLLGALPGFLWFNRPPARIFMGDSGSTFLGFLLGLGTARLALRDGGPPWRWAVPLCLAAVPCYDLLTVVLLRLSQGRSPFRADRQHLSHRLVARGLPGPRAVRVIHLLALASGASGLLLYAVGNGAAAALVGLQLAAWWAALALIEWRRG